VYQTDLLRGWGCSDFGRFESPAPAVAAKPVPALTNLPKQSTSIWRVVGASNRCRAQFEKRGQKTNQKKPLFISLASKSQMFDSLFGHAAMPGGGSFSSCLNSLCNRARNVILDCCSVLLMVVVSLSSFLSFFSS